MVTEMSEMSIMSEDEYKKIIVFETIMLIVFVTTSVIVLNLKLKSRPVTCSEMRIPTIENLSDARHLFGNYTGSVKLIHLKEINGMPTNFTIEEFYENDVTTWWKYMTFENILCDSSRGYYKSIVGKDDEGHNVVLFNKPKRLFCTYPIPKDIVCYKRRLYKVVKVDSTIEMED